MSRESLLAHLKQHHSADPAERRMIEDTIRFVADHPDCFERSLLEGHVTGSAWILNPERSHALLLHHAKLNKWLQPGGHCDGDADVLRVSMKEVFEETGLTATPMGNGVFDVDVHVIPQRGEVPGHLHYDICYLMEALKQGEQVQNNHESHAVRWVGLTDIPNYTDSESVLRKVRKTLDLAT